MRKKMERKPKPVPFKMRIRIYAGDRILGHGKAELLSCIDASGSLAAAAREMGMSYMRAWTLVQDLNGNPARPMVEMSRGGPKGKTGRLTPLGKKVCDLYQRMDRASTVAAGPYARRLARLLK